MTNEPEPNTRAGGALKPCPFCSGEMVVRDDFLKHSLEPSMCILAGAVFHIRQQYDWNTRPQPYGKVHTDGSRSGGQMPSEEQPALYTCKHGCERDTIMDQLAKLQADGDKLAGALAKRAYHVTEPYLSGARLCIGFGHKDDAFAAHYALTEFLTEWKDQT